MKNIAPYQPITADNFLRFGFPSENRYELIAGAIYKKPASCAVQIRVTDNILIYLGSKLRGSGCRPYNADMGVRVTDTDVRYPDVSVYCGNPATPERERERVFTDPIVIFEVLSASTVRVDEGEKLAQYRALSSVDTIVFVDPENEMSRVIQRLGPTSWRDDLFAQPHDVALPALGLSIPHGEIFARD